MKTSVKPALDSTQTIHLLPRWVTSARGQDADTVAFSSGAALALLDVVVRDPGPTVPAPLLRDRMAMQAAAACLKLEGRNDTTSDIRDAVCLARAGDALGPAGEMFMAWRQMARINLTVSTRQSHLMKLLPDPIAEYLSELTMVGDAPVAQASQVLVEVLQRFPRHEAAALMLADVALARGVGWDRPVPIFAAHLKRGDVRALGEGASDALTRVHHAVIDGCDAVLRKAGDLNRRAANLESIAPKLRAKGADAALAVFLSHDAVSPSGMLTRGTAVAMTDRAARRLCDRLVDLDVVRELTGRTTFRLYGL